MKSASLCRDAGGQCSQTRRLGTPGALDIGKHRSPMRRFLPGFALMLACACTPLSQGKYKVSFEEAVDSCDVDPDPRADGEWYLFVATNASNWDWTLVMWDAVAEPPPPAGYMGIHTDEGSIEFEDSVENEISSGAGGTCVSETTTQIVITPINAKEFEGTAGVTWNLCDDSECEFTWALDGSRWK